MAGFKFWTTAPVPFAAGADWRGGLKRLEDLGFDAVVLPDHFTGGWGADPLVALAAAAGFTSTLRLATGVLGNDYRHPVQTHRMAATVDVVSDGRLVLGMGAGWLASDYEAAGLALDDARTRIERLDESVRIVKALFGAEPVDFVGEHYSVKALTGAPAAVQQPHVPIMIGGGRPVMLRLAAREADIIGINTNTAAGHSGTHSIVDFSAEAVRRKVGWVHDGLAAAGRTAGDVELHILHWLMRVTSTAQEGADFLERIAARNGVAADLLAESPAVLVGTVDQIVDALLERRETFGFSIIQLDAGFAVPNLTQFAPVIERLS